MTSRLRSSATRFIVIVAALVLVIGGVAVLRGDRRRGGPVEVSTTTARSTTTSSLRTSTTTAQTTTTTHPRTTTSTNAPTTSVARTTTTLARRTTTTVVTTTTLRSIAEAWWHPPTGLQPWQWELDHPLDPTNATDMGTNDTLPDGSIAPRPVIYDIDGIENSASTVAALHASGAKVICYVEVGAAGDYGGAYSTYYDQLNADGDLGNKVAGYSERFVNINAPSAVAVVESIIKEQCATKGFDAVETDLDETYGTNEGSTGFAITLGDEESYLTTLARYMHSLGLAWFAKNLDDTGDQSFVSAMMGIADGAVTEQCNEYSTCGLYGGVLGRKLILNAEYNLPVTSFCSKDESAGISGALFPVALNGARHPC